MHTDNASFSANVNQVYGLACKRNEHRLGGQYKGKKEADWLCITIYLGRFSIMAIYNNSEFAHFWWYKIERPFLFSILSFFHSPMPHTTLPDHSSKDNIDALLLHTVSRLKKLIRCSKERTSYQHLLLPSLSTFVKHMSIQCRLSSTVLVVALIYLKRLEQNLPALACGGRYNMRIISTLDEKTNT